MQLSTLNSLPKPFWVVWAIEFWERFGYYGTQAILALYFLHYLGFTQQESFYLFGIFSAFVYGFVWIGGYIGDKYLGAKRTLVLGAIILMLAYLALAFATKSTAYYALAGIVMGNSLFKANPSSLISKLYAKGDVGLDIAMTMYYMAINLGSIFSMFLTPILANTVGYKYGFLLCSFGLFCGLLNFFIFYRVLNSIATTAGKESLQLGRLFNVIWGVIMGIFIIAELLKHLFISQILIVVVVSLGFIYFLKIAFSLQQRERLRMIVAFVLILEGIIFFVLYFQMPTSLTFFALHNINNVVMGISIPPAEYQVLNPLTIIIMSPILAKLYQQVRMTHVDKFCIGMTLCALAFLILYFPQFTTDDGLASPWWMVATYWFQSTGELFISGLGLAMVAELCPSSLSGFVMGIWFLASMIAGPIAAWVGGLTAPSAGVQIAPLESIAVYSRVFAQVGIITALVAALMWLTRPFFNRLI